MNLDKMFFKNFSDKDLIIINNVSNEFCNGLNIKNYVEELSLTQESICFLLHKMKEMKKEKEFFEEWSLNEEIDDMKISGNEVHTIIKILDKIFYYLDADDIYTRIGYPVDEIEKVKCKVEQLSVHQAQIEKL